MNAHKEETQSNTLSNCPYNGSSTGLSNRRPTNEIKGDPRMNHSIRMLSGISHDSNASVLDPNTQHRVRRIRRQFRRCENDAAFIAMISAAFGAGPLCTALDYIFFYRLDPPEGGNSTNSQAVALTICEVISIVWMTACYSHYYPSQQSQLEVEFERGIRLVGVMGFVLLYIHHLFQLSMRCLCLSIFVAWFKAWVIIPIAGHYLFCYLMLSIYQCTNRQASTRLPLPISEGFTRTNRNGSNSSHFGIDSIPYQQRLEQRVRLINYYLLAIERQEVKPE